MINKRRRQECPNPRRDHRHEEVKAEGENHESQDVFQRVTSNLPLWIRSVFLSPEPEKRNSLYIKDGHHSVYTLVCITNGVQRSSSGTPSSRGEGQQTASSYLPVKEATPPILQTLSLETIKQVSHVQLL